MTFKILRFFFAVLVSSTPILALASPTWESTYTENNYCSWGNVADQFPNIEIGQTCTNEGAVIEIFGGGSQGYDCDPYTTLEIICCGDKLKCPQSRDDYED